MNDSSYIGKMFMALALVLLMLGLVFGILSSVVYLYPEFLKDSIGFVSLRPIHVSLVVFWIIIAASGGVMTALQMWYPEKLSQKMGVVQLLLWIIAIVGIMGSYLRKDFGGREYWEFNPVWALPIALSWILYLINFFKVATGIKKWPVYVWMWMSGGTFFLFTFIENYLWIFPYFREHLVTDMTIQWKVNGSLVGSWNQLIYGLSFFIMDRINGDHKVGSSKMAFAMYFLGLFNLMFNWGHHIYTLPTDNYIRYIGYAVSMTEWIFFARIVLSWKQSVTEMQKHYHFFPYRFLMASEWWVFINMGQAILMSIPALNLYTHGTHVTVAHAMGTTIGINTMILLSACFIFLKGECVNYNRPTSSLNIAFWGIQVSLFVFWLSLNLAGIQKGIWQNGGEQTNYHHLMKSLLPYFTTFSIAGVFLLISLFVVSGVLLYNFVRCSSKSFKKSLVLNSSKPTTI